VAGKAWAGELIRTSLRDVNYLLARGVLGKLEGGDGVRGVYWFNGDADLEINWNLTPIFANFRRVVNLTPTPS